MKCKAKIGIFLLSSLLLLASCGGKKTGKSNCGPTCPVGFKEEISVVNRMAE